MLHFVKAGSRVEEEYTYCRNRAEAERWGNTGAYGGGRKWAKAKAGREEGRVEYETTPTLRDN